MDSASFRLWWIYCFGYFFYQWYRNLCIVCLWACSESMYQGTCEVVVKELIYILEWTFLYFCEKILYSLGKRNRTSTDALRLTNHQVTVPFRGSVLIETLFQITFCNFIFCYHRLSRCPAVSFLHQQGNTPGCQLTYL